MNRISDRYQVGSVSERFPIIFSQTCFLFYHSSPRYNHTYTCTLKVEFRSPCIRFHRVKYQTFGKRQNIHCRIKPPIDAVYKHLIHNIFAQCHENFFFLSQITRQHYYFCHFWRRTIFFSILNWVQQKKNKVVLNF